MKPTQNEPPLRPKEEIHVMRGFGPSLSDKEREAVRKSLEEQKDKFMTIQRVKSAQSSRGMAR